jgi:hypothetical protein
VPRSYASLADFLSADPRREGGDQLELGGWWRDIEGEVFSAAWAPGSGELYIRDHESGRVRVIGEPMDRGEVVRRMDGWPGVVGRRASVEWLLAQAAPRTKRAPAGGIVSSAWMRSPSSLKRTLVCPLGQHALSPAA